MALPVRRCSGEHLDGAGRVHADARAFVATPAHAQSRVGLRWGEPADLDVARDADAAIVAARFRLGAALLEALVIGHRKRAVERGCVIAAVVGDPADGVERERVGRNEVLASDLGGVHTDLVGEPVHDPFDQQRGLGPARAPVRVDRGGVGVRAAHLVVERRYAVRARHDEDMEDGRNTWRERL